jgi:WD40 repeat protein
MHDDDVEWATFSPDGVHVVTASDDNTARIWNVTGTELSLTQLKLLAQLLSGYKMLDDAGTPLLMTPEEFQDAYRQWRAR